MRVLSIILALCFFCSYNLNAQDKKKKNTEEVTFKVSMSCNNCKQKIEKNLPWEKGVKDMEVDLATKTVKLKFDSKKTSTDKLKKAIEDLNFASVEEVSKDKKDEVKPAS